MPRINYTRTTESFSLEIDKLPNGFWRMLAAKLQEEEDGKEYQRYKNKCTKAIEHNITWEELEDEASEYDVKAECFGRAFLKGHLEYRKRKNKFFDTECKESKPKRRKKRPQVIETESEDETESPIVELIEIEE